MIGSYTIKFTDLTTALMVFSCKKPAGFKVSLKIFFCSIYSKFLENMSFESEYFDNCHFAWLTTFDLNKVLIWISLFA